jgi:dephospho-CoA kinase
MNIGLTGGIACGKSTVADMLVRRGAILIDADRIAREMVMVGSPALQKIAGRFGRDLLLADGSLDRKKLGNIVFNDEKARKDLEDILHPPIRQSMKERMMEAERLQPDKLVVVDVPLMYESGLQLMFEQVMVVYAPREMQLTRLMHRDQLTKEEAEQRLLAQMPIEEKRKLADIVIHNDSQLEMTERQIDEFWQRKGLR